jgi:hypothetical protein
MESGGRSSCVEARDGWSKLEVLSKVISGIFVPLLVFYFGSLFAAQQKEAEESQRRSDRISELSRQLASDNPRERGLALGVLQEFERRGVFPSELTPVLRNIVYRDDDTDLASRALLILGSDDAFEDDYTDEQRLFDLLTPMMVHLVRTRYAFTLWDSCRETDVIYGGNLFIRDLLEREKKLIPADLEEDARKLVEHYDKWLEKFESQRAAGERGVCLPVYVGPDGYPFPADSAGRFRARFVDLKTALHRRVGLDEPENR